MHDANIDGILGEKTVWGLKWRVQYKKYEWSYLGRHSHEIKLYLPFIYKFYI